MKQLETNIECELPGAVFNFELKKPLTVVCGDSGSGKTLFCKALYNLERVSSVGIGVLDQLSSYFTIEQMLGMYNTVFVIDNADYLMYNDLFRGMLNESMKKSNQFILLTHQDLDIKEEFTKELSRAKLCNKKREGGLGLEYYLQYTGEEN